MIPSWVGHRPQSSPSGFCSPSLTMLWIRIRSSGANTDSNNCWTSAQVGSYALRIPQMVRTTFSGSFLSLGICCYLPLCSALSLSSRSEPYPPATLDTLPIPVSVLTPSPCSALAPALAPAPCLALASTLCASPAPHLGPGPPFSEVPSPMLSSTPVPRWHGLTPVGS